MLTVSSCTYHVIPEAIFYKIFSDHVIATPQLNTTSESPYATHLPATPLPAEADGSAISELACVTIDMCAGHFHRMPALPVSIMMRHVFDCIVLAIVRRENLPEGSIRVFAVDIKLQANRFIYSGKF